MHTPVSRRSETSLSRFALVVVLPLLCVTGCNKSPTTQGEEPAPEASEVVGALEVVNADGIFGYAWDSSRPDKAIKVDLFDGDKKLATIVANEFRQDLVDNKIGDGKHAFSYTTIPDRLKDGKTHTIRVRVSGTDHDLTNSPMNLKAP
jgi:hypothetical protein